MKLYEVDVVDTFELYMSHLHVDIEYMFYPIIDNPRTKSWYTKGRVSKRNLKGVLKSMYEDSGLLSEGITNRVGRATLISHMQQEGVPLRVGMAITRHKFESTYLAYDRNKDVVVRAAQRSASEGSNFALNLQKETANMKENLFEGRKGQELKIPMRGLASGK